MNVAGDKGDNKQQNLGSRRDAKPMGQRIISSFSAQIFPLICTLMSTANEDGIKQKYYIVANWVPFDKYEYYYTTYIIQFIFTIYAEMYIIFCGTFFLSILNNIFGQILVLEDNINKIYGKAKIQCENDRNEFKQACNYFAKQCIQEHQNIISLVQQLDETFENYIFVDYICTSFGLSIVVLQFLLEDTLQMKIAAIGFFLAFASQSLIIYYNADIVAIESSHGLSLAIFRSDWFELDSSAIHMLQIVIARAQKPLTLSIGPFKKVGVESMIALFKATYSFLSVMW
ncbi:odorant receptor 30a-like [Diorhabda carinulata]|uniref:odorant receptor 30a-like n=1 Tax=Diorhabda carinulata TaxID=1163345 RepID=UPI0025A27AF7|nr:odorant receptor 30a-like [Diorhabda carinulata]